MDISRFTVKDGVASLIVSGVRVLLDEFDLGQLDRPGAIEIRSGYARLRYKKKRVSVHRLLLNAPDNMVVDHINRDRADNRRCNLRLCTISQNSRNSKGNPNRQSRYKGVFYHREGYYTGKKGDGRPKRWRAYTRIKGKRIWLGYYHTEEEAAQAYNEYARREFGEFACLNEV